MPSSLVLVLRTLSIARTVCAASNMGLRLEVYNNTALAGVPFDTRVSSNASFTVQATTPFSAALTGTLTADAGCKYAFDCDFGRASLGFLHVDDHLVCQFGANFRGNVTHVDNPFPARSRSQLAVRLSVISNETSGAARDVVIRVNATASCDDRAPSRAGGNPVTFSPVLPALELRRERMQQTMREGWGLWYDMSFLTHVLLPEGAALTVALCEVAPASHAPTSTPRCITQARTDWPPDDAGPDGTNTSVRLGMHAYDRSYGDMHVAGLGGCNVSIAFGGGDHLLLALTVVDGSTCDRHAIVFAGSSVWSRAVEWRAATPTGGHLGELVEGDVSLVFAAHGLRTDTLHVSAASDVPAAALPANLASQSHVAVSLARTPHVALSSGMPLRYDEVVLRLGGAREAERARYAPYGDFAELKQLVQAAVMWNVIYTPLERGPIAPVIRGNPWSLNQHPVSDDWVYILFDWDVHFAAYMLSLDAPALAYSSLIQVVRSKTAAGFVPNSAAATHKAPHSQPPLGSRVLLEMTRRWGETWVAELLFDDLLDWNRWREAVRTLLPYNLTCLGGSDMQQARFESGLDNSPMYDDWPDDFLDGKMQLYDVGTASLHAMDTHALAELASRLHRPEATQLAAQARRTTAALVDHLWDGESGAFVNRFVNGSFHRRVSPTSFYPLLTGGPSDEQVATMVSRWLTNASRFCISPTGDFAGNSDTCYWGLPSISADDPAFPALGYWRGYVWAPMAMLVYWALSEYLHVEVVRDARKALTTQMASLVLTQWRRHHHVCENFSPYRNATECTGMHFYHWGALTGFLSLLEHGFYEPHNAVGP